MNRDIEIMAKTIYGEARGEYKKYGEKSLEAVGHVIMNRANNYKSSIEAICLQPWQFSCWNKKDPNRQILENLDLENPIYKLCYVISKKIICNEYEDITNGATHYYSSYMKKPPYWAYNENPICKIGHHIFFKLK